eukprot:SAG11_NODE_182_length_13233_cov_59.525238_6_plen_84_part_00
MHLRCDVAWVKRSEKGRSETCVELHIGHDEGHNCIDHGPRDLDCACDRVSLTDPATGSETKAGTPCMLDARSGADCSNARAKT